MNGPKLTVIAHGDLEFCNPVNSEKVDRVIGLLELPAGARVFDAGCGKAEMLIRIVERYGARGVGVDTNREFLNVARARAVGRARLLDGREREREREGSLELHEVEAAQFLTGHAHFDAALCVGSTHAFGDYRHTLRALSGAVRPGGLLLIGEGFWKRDPHPDYLVAVGANRAEFTDHEGNVALAVKAGLVPLYASVSSEDDWDHYEGLYLRAVERYVAGNPDDADGERMRTHIRKWRDAYLRWGRQTLGFAMYLFRK